VAIGIGDIVGAKIAAQLGWVAAPALRAELGALDITRTNDDLISILVEKGYLDTARAGKLRRYLDLYERVRREALYIALLERAQILSKEELASWKQRIEDEGYETSLGEHLLAAKKITAVQSGQLRQQQFLGLDKENERLLAGYKKSRFEGVGRPLTKNPQAKIETGVFTIKELFRSAESQRLARAATMATTESLAGETTPGLRTPLKARVVSEVPETVGAYKVEGVLGRGGMGIVLQARHEKGGDAVAVKLALNRERGPNFDEIKARLRREILATSMVAHENIVQVLDAGELEDGTPYLVMELVKGKELREVLKQKGALPPKQALAVFVQVLSAVSAAHRAGIVHRDLKPENVLVVEESGRLVAKLMDFGLAKIVEMDPAHESKVFQTLATNVVSGSPAYLSPEQVLGDEIGPRADLYALGVVLFEILTGTYPWQAGTVNELLRAHTQKAPRRLADAAPGKEFPPALEALVASLLEKNPAKRPESAEAVMQRIEVEVLAAFHVGSSSEARAPSSKPRGITRILESLREDEETT